MIKTVIFGGSFDPVHKAHENIINELSLRFDEVIVMPTSVSPFKRGGSAASAEMRIKMLKACEFASNVTVSDYEVNKQGCSYSIDTVRHFADNNRELYFAIGSEGARSVNKWYCADELKKLTKFYVIKRPGYDESAINDEFIKADFCGDDISSSEVKVAVAMDKLEGLVSDGVARIIEDNGLYRDYCVYTAAYQTFGLKSERIEHTYRATIEGIKLAKRYDVDVKDVSVALLLHDIGKYVTPQKLRDMNIIVPIFDDLPQECKHAEYGAAICEQYFHLNKSIVQAVKTHTTCGMEMDKLAQIVALADYVEPGRKFDGVDEIRNVACVSLTLAIEMMLKNTIDYLTVSGKPIAPITIETYRKYKKINEKENELWNKLKK